MLRVAMAATVAGLCLLTAPAVSTEMSAPDLENVPVDRLVANLERLVTQEPSDISLRINLARVHAMAYAQKTNSISIRRGRDREGPYLGFKPLHEQAAVKRTSNDAAAQLAQRHLTSAIERYGEALALSPENLIAKMGLGWCLLQAGRKEEAVAALRDVSTRAWPDDREGKGTGPNQRWVWHGHRSLTEEAARYLRPLLDPVRDKDELATLRERVRHLERMPRPITPIAIPLRDGLTARDITSDARVRFDADGSGLKREWTWITPDAGWLVYDQTGTRHVESALKLFGNVTFWLFWDNGYHALRALDDDGDGRLSGKELRYLAIWHDRNSNGRSESGEVKPLRHWQIVALSYAHQHDANHPHEIAFAPAGVTFSDGTTRPTFDLILFGH